MDKSTTNFLLVAALAIGAIVWYKKTHKKAAAPAAAAPAATPAATAVAPTVAAHGSVVANDVVATASTPLSLQAAMV